VTFDVGFGIFLVLFGVLVVSVVRYARRLGPRGRRR
jgi:heme/copper-type cytochrome/quinol oxidase subunit 2